MGGWVSKRVGAGGRGRAAGQQGCVACRRPGARQGTWRAAGQVGSGTCAHHLVSVLLEPGMRASLPGWGGTQTCGGAWGIRVGVNAGADVAPVPAANKTQPRQRRQAAGSGSNDRSPQSPAGRRACPTTGSNTFSTTVKAVGRRTCPTSHTARSPILMSVLAILRCSRPRARTGNSTKDTTARAGRGQGAAGALA